MCQGILECDVLVGTRSAEGIMASGHVNRIKRPNTWLHRPMLQNREESSCQTGAVHTWHETDMPTALRDVRSQGQTGKHILALSFSGFDPTRTSADSVDQQLYSLKAERLATVSIIGC